MEKQEATSWFQCSSPTDPSRGASCPAEHWNLGHLIHPEGASDLIRPLEFSLENELLKS